MIHSPLLATVPGVSFGFSTLEDADENDRHRVGSPDPDGLHGLHGLAARLGVARDHLAIPRQRHTANVSVVGTPGWYEAVDALVTATPGLWLRVSVADCVPLFLATRDGGVVAAVHGGWRGAAGGVALRTVEVLQQMFKRDPEELLAFIGPSAGPCCYEVKEDVATLFREQVLERREGKTYLDLRKEHLRQLREAGVEEKHVEVHDSCTICTPALFHSYRREGLASGRMLGFISIKEERRD